LWGKVGVLHREIKELKEKNGERRKQEELPTSSSEEEQ
jgi:hypothetical protein